MRSICQGTEGPDPRDDIGRRREVFLRFRGLIHERHDHDLIMNVLVMVVIMLMPVLVAAVLKYCSDNGVYFLEWFQYLTFSSPVLLPVLVEPIIVMMVLYRLHTRLRAHSIRDREWRECLIDYASTYTDDVSGLVSLNEESCRRSRFPERHLALLAIIITSVCVLDAMLYWIPVYSYGMSTPSVMVSTCLQNTILGMAAMLMIVGYRVLQYPYIHEECQIRFVDEFCRVMEENGVTVCRMEPKVRHCSMSDRLALFIVTFGLYSAVMVYEAFENFNSHIKSQWEYENRLLAVLDEDSDGDEEPIPPVLMKKSRVILERRFDMPFTLICAEVFMMLIITLYLCKLIGMGCDMESMPLAYDLRYIYSDIPPFDHIDTSVCTTNLVLSVFDLFFMMLALDSLITLESRRSTAWRSIVRSCFTFAFMTWIMYYLYGSYSYIHVFDMNPYLVSSVLYVLLLFMFISEPVKKFYTPMTMRVPSMKKWMRFAISGSLGQDRRCR